MKYKCAKVEGVQQILKLQILIFFLGVSGSFCYGCTFYKIFQVHWCIVYEHFSMF